MKSQAGMILWGDFENFAPFFSPSNITTQNYGIPAAAAQVRET